MGARSRLVFGRLLATLLVWAATLAVVPLSPTATLALQAVRRLSVPAPLSPLLTLLASSPGFVATHHQAPLLCVLAFGVYSAGTVAWSVATFPESPQAAVELQVDIADARRDLRKRGVVLKGTPT
jgi:Dolichol-phosphate mannosyltransferase subunit 3 (DPM3)